MSSRRRGVLLLILSLFALPPAAAAAADDSAPDDHTIVADAPINGGEADRSGLTSFVFPVPADHSFSNDWHAPRDGGARLHKGTDVFTDKHTPVVAVVDGTIVLVRHSNTGLSGNMVVLEGDDGVRYFYIHLNNDEPGTDNGENLYDQAFAPGIKAGTEVHAGDPVGFVGDSGNAENTPSHLHFGVRAPDGAAVNPYPILAAADPGGTYVLDITALATTGGHWRAPLLLALLTLTAGAHLLGLSALAGQSARRVERVLVPAEPSVAP